MIIATDLFLTLSDDVDDVIQTEHILITDVSQSSGDTLICWSTRAQRSFSWFHQFIGSEELTELPRVTENKPSYFGWKSELGRKLEYNKLTLLRVIGSVPIEGVFTCSVEIKLYTFLMQPLWGFIIQVRSFCLFYSCTHHQKLPI